MKKLKLTFNSCKKCPYNHFSHFDDLYCSVDGYYCNHPKSPDIIMGQNSLIITSQNLYKSNSIWPKFPNWCPLPDKKE